MAEQVEERQELVRHAFFGINNPLMPLEILHQILSYLDNPRDVGAASQVMRSWWDVLRPEQNDEAGGANIVLNDGDFEGGNRNIHMAEWHDEQRLAGREALGTPQRVPLGLNAFYESLPDKLIAWSRHEWIRIRREGSKWRITAIDNFLSEHLFFRFPDNQEAIFERYGHQRRYIKEKHLYGELMTTEMDVHKYFQKLNQQQQRSIIFNPFLARSVVLENNETIDVMAAYLCTACKLGVSTVITYGSHVRHLSLNVDDENGGRVVESLAFPGRPGTQLLWSVKNILTTTPQLKSLYFSFFHTISKEDNVKGYINSFSTNQITSLKSLTIKLQIETEDEEIEQSVIKYILSTAPATLGRFTLAAKTLGTELNFFQNLQEMILQIDSPPMNLEKLHYWPQLRRITIGYNLRIITQEHFDFIKEMVKNCSESLGFLSIRYPPNAKFPSSIKNFCLTSATNLQTYEVINGSGLGYDFLVGLESLRKLHISHDDATFSSLTFEDKLKIRQFLPIRTMNDANAFAQETHAWRLLPRLEVITYLWSTQAHNQDYRQEMVITRPGPINPT